NSSGYDIIFTAADGSTLLNHQLEKYTATTGEYISWVLIPSLSATVDTEIYLYFGNSTVFTNPSTTATWNSNYLAVWHFNTTVSDATVNAHNLTDLNTNAVTTGKIAGAREFTGDGDELGDATSTTYLDGLADFSITMWVKSDVTGTDRGMFYGAVPNGTDLLLGLRYDAAGTSGGGSNIVHGMVKVGSNNKLRYESASGVQTTNWQNLALTKISGAALVLYINGVKDTPTYSNAKAGSTSGNSSLKIGKGSKDGTTSSWDGLIDEVRISNVARSADWVATEYNTTNAPGSFFSVSAVNEAPVLANIETVDLAYAAGSGAANVTMSITITDYNNLNLSGATIQISANYLNTEDVLAFTNQNGISGSWNSSTGIMTLSGSASLANYQMALRSVTYTNTNGTPSTATRTVTFTVNDGTASSNSQTRNIALNVTNSAPVLSSIEGTALAYTDGGPALALTSSLLVTDSDDAYLESGQVVITTNYINGEDLLSFTNNGITGSWNSSTGTMTLSGTASVADYQAALRSITYSNLNPAPSTVTRTVSLTVNDGSDPSNTVTRDISVTAVNDAPTLSDIETTPITYNPGDGAVTTTATIVAADGDNTNLAGATIWVSTNYFSGEDVLAFTNQLGITGSWNSVTGTLTLSGTTTIANYQTALRAVTYNNTNLSPSFSTRVLSFTVSDGSATSAAVTRNIAWGTPGTLSNLQLWLRADVGVYSDAGVTPATEGQSVRQWNDQSGNSRHFTGAVKRPVFRAASAALD
ncbi:MAG: DUF2341 domain-containing protein, partial [Candidatus Neomarinimicrobiota bacterium]